MKKMFRNPKFIAALSAIAVIAVIGVVYLTKGVEPIEEDIDIVEPSSVAEVKSDFTHVIDVSEQTISGGKGYIAGDWYYCNIKDWFTEKGAFIKTNINTGEVVVLKNKSIGSFEIFQDTIYYHNDDYDDEDGYELDEDEESEYHHASVERMNLDGDNIGTLATSQNKNQYYNYFIDRERGIVYILEYLEYDDDEETTKSELYTLGKDGTKKVVYTFEDYIDGDYISHVQNGYIYIASDYEDYIKINIETLKKTELDNSDRGEIIFHDGVEYEIAGESSDWYEIYGDGKLLSEFKGNYIDNILAHGGYIFINVSDKLYQYNIGKKEITLMSKEVESFSVSDDAVYCINHVQEISKYTLSGKLIKTKYVTSYGDIEGLVEVGDWLYDRHLRINKKNFKTEYYQNGIWEEKIQKSSYEKAKKRNGRFERFDCLGSEGLVSVIAKKSIDVTNDGVPEKVYLAKSAKDETIVYTIIKDGVTNEYSSLDLSYRVQMKGVDVKDYEVFYEGKLDFYDFDGNGVNDICFSFVEGPGGGSYSDLDVFFSVISYKNGEYNYLIDGKNYINNVSDTVGGIMCPINIEIKTTNGVAEVLAKIGDVVVNTYRYSSYEKKFIKTNIEDPIKVRRVLAG